MELYLIGVGFISFITILFTVSVYREYDGEEDQEIVAGKILVAGLLIAVSWIIVIPLAVSGLVGYVLYKSVRLYLYGCKALMEDDIIPLLTGKHTDVNLISDKVSDFVMLGTDSGTSYREDNHDG